MKSESEFTDLLQEIREELGPVASSKFRNGRVSWLLPQGTMVNLIYDSRFATGPGTEQFIWHISDGHAVLRGYQVFSPSLVGKHTLNTKPLPGGP